MFIYVHCSPASWVIFFSGTLVQWSGSFGWFSHMLNKEMMYIDTMATRNPAERCGKTECHYIYIYIMDKFSEFISFAQNKALGQDAVHQINQSSDLQFIGYQLLHPVPQAKHPKKITARKGRRFLKLMQTPYASCINWTKYCRISHDESTANLFLRNLFYLEWISGESPVLLAFGLPYPNCFKRQGKAWALVPNQSPTSTGTFAASPTRVSS